VIGAAAQGQFGLLFPVFGRAAWLPEGRQHSTLPRCGTSLLCDRSLPDRAHVLTHAAMTARARDYDVLAEGIVVGRIMKAAAAAPLPAWRRDEREPRTDIRQTELQLRGLGVARRRGLNQLRGEDRGADP